MVKRLTSNLGIKLISLLLAIVVWLIIQSLADPTITRQFRNVPVTIRNESALTRSDEKFTYTVVSGDTVSFSVEGRTSVVSSMSESDFNVYADLNKLSVVGAVPIEISVRRYASNVTVLPQTNMMIIEMDELVELSVPVNVRVTGDPGSGYTTGDITSNPNLVKIQGPKSLLDNARALVVDVNVSGRGGQKDEQGNEITTITTTEANPVLIDGNGDAITASTVEIDLAQPITASVDILQTKSVAVQLTFEDFTAAEGFALLPEAEYSPRTITIAATQEMLETLLEEAPVQDDGLPILTYTVSGRRMDPLTANYESYFVLPLPEHVKVMEESVRDKGISYRINVVSKVAQTLELTYGDLVMRGRSGTYEYALSGVKSTDPLTLTLTGIQEEVEAFINQGEISAVIDVSGLEPGTHTVPISITLPEGVALQEEITVSVKVTAPETETESESETKS